MSQIEILGSPTKFFQAAQIINGALDSMQTAESKAHWRVVVPPVIEKKKCLEGDAGRVVSDGVCCLLQKVLEAVGKGEEAVNLKRWLAKMLVELFRESCLFCFVDYWSKTKNENEGLVAGEDERLVSA